MYASDRRMRMPSAGHIIDGIDTSRFESVHPHGREGIGLSRKTLNVCKILAANMALGSTFSSCRFSMWALHIVDASFSELPTVQMRLNDGPESGQRSTLFIWTWNLNIGRWTSWTLAIRMVAIWTVAIGNRLRASATVAFWCCWLWCNRPLSCVRA